MVDSLEIDCSRRLEMKTEYSLECEICGNYNIQEGVILNGDVICWNCIKKFPNKFVLPKKKIRK
jgi:formylmethanofuran dehydrogenase subunit E